MRVGLALGAGGVVGASWIVGALEGLEAQSGFRATDADLVLGTSSGSLIAALVAARVPTAAMAAYASGESHEGLAVPVGHDATALSLARIPVPFGPGSLRMLFSARNPAVALAGLLPRGIVRTDAIRELVERAIGSRWPRRGALRIVACDYSTGRRVAFDGVGDPAVTPGEAVAASCAIPALYAPVQIGGRRYIDGGIHSHSNLDLLADAGLDAVICLNPMSSGAWVGGGGLRERLVASRRRRSAALLADEVAALRAAGTRVLVLEPAFADLAAMGSNMMARDRRIEVLEAARASTERTLRRIGRRRLGMVGLAAG
jgi:NTE family protein